MSDELKDLDDNELHLLYKEKLDEYAKCLQMLEPYEDDMEEGNFDGDSIGLITYRGEIESELEEIREEAYKRGIDFSSF